LQLLSAIDGLADGTNIIGIIVIFAAIARRCCVRQAEGWANRLSKTFSLLLVNIETNLAQTSLLLFEQTRARSIAIWLC